MADFALMAWGDCGEKISPTRGADSESVQTNAPSSSFPLD